MAGLRPFIEPVRDPSPSHIPSAYGASARKENFGMTSLISQEMRALCRSAAILHILGLPRIHPEISNRKPRGPT